MEFLAALTRKSFRFSLLRICMAFEAFAKFVENIFFLISFFNQVLISKGCYVGICEISLRRSVSYQMLPSVIYQNAKRASSSQARLSVHVLVHHLLYASRGAFLPRVPLMLELLVPSLSFSHSHPTTPFSPPTIVLMYQFHSTCVVAAVFTATPLPDSTTSYW